MRKQREKANLTQAEIAERLGPSPKSGKMYISAFERGKKKNSSIETILKYLRPAVLRGPPSTYFQVGAGAKLKT